jgi:phosphotriesterase-related protein
MKVQSVLGEIAASELGIVLVHEHLLADLGCWFEQPQTTNRLELVDKPVTASMRGILNSDPYHCRDNLILDDWRLVADELQHFRAAGGATVVDLTSRTLGPQPEELREIALVTGLHIIASTGFYVQRAHPAWVENASVESLAEFMLAELNAGIGETNIRAGIIGEIGVSSPIHEHEKKVMHAAALAQKDTGAAINVHLPIFGREGHNALDLLEDKGADLTRVVLSHLDETNDYNYIRSLGNRGVYLELDTFGSEVAWDESGEHEPSDWQRIELLVRLLTGGFARQLLLSQDVCTKMQLMHFGGVGYAHILRTIVPRLRNRGITKQILDEILITNPARMLSGEILTAERA